MVTDRQPQPLREWAEIIREKDAEIAKLKRRIEQLEAQVYENERQFHVDMGR